MNDVLRLDRSPPFRIAEIASLAASAPLYAVLPDDATAADATALVLDEVQLVAWDGAERGAGGDATQRVADRLARLQASGAAVLDARALAGLLEQPDAIPGSWRARLESAARAGPAASIRFLGSRFRHFESGAIHVLGLSLQGDRWVARFEPLSDAGGVVLVPIVGPGAESDWAAGD